MSHLFPSKAVQGLGQDSVRVVFCVQLTWRRSLTTTDGRKGEPGSNWCVPGVIDS